MPKIIDRILDEMDDSREERYSKDRKNLIRQFGGFRNDWSAYVDRWSEEGTIFID